MPMLWPLSSHLLEVKQELFDEMEDFEMETELPADLPPPPSQQTAAVEEEEEEATAAERGLLFLQI